MPSDGMILCHFFKLFSLFLELVVRYETGSRSVIHYLDDFLFISPGGSDQCQYLLDTFRFMKFGVPLSQEKTEGSCTVLSLLGIEIDSVCMVSRLPADKLAKLSDLIKCNPFWVCWSLLAG